MLKGEDTEMSHTPGPWRVYEGKLRPRFPTHILEVQDSKGRAVVPWTGFDACDVPKSQRKANARLIAAAPELLEALREIAKGEGAFSLDPLTHCSNTVDSMKAIALAAIAKAEDKEGRG